MLVLRNLGVAKCWPGDWKKLIAVSVGSKSSRSPFVSLVSLRLACIYTRTVARAWAAGFAVGNGGLYISCSLSIYVMYSGPIR